MEGSNLDKQIWIIMPVYNMERYIKQTVRSIQKQSFVCWKLVLIDDGSTDRSGRICDEFAAKDNRVVVIHIKNGGPAAARKRGLELVRDTDYCCFCDSDDELPPDALMSLYREAVRTDSDLVCGRMQRLWHGVTMTLHYQPPCFRTPRVYEYSEIMEHLYISCFGISNFPMSLCGKLYRAEVVKKAQAGITQGPQKFAEDLNLTMRIMPHCRRISIIPDVIYRYRIGGGTTRFMPTFLSDNLLMYRIKKEWAGLYTGSENPQKFIAIELKNIMVTYLQMYARYKNGPDDCLHNEIVSVCTTPEVAEALQTIRSGNFDKSEMAQAMIRGDYGQIERMIREYNRKNRWKYTLQRLLFG